MSTRRVLAPLSLLLALVSVLIPAAAAQAAAGSVEGTVVSTTSGNYLNNARIVVEGTALETFTD